VLPAMLRPDVDADGNAGLRPIFAGSHPVGLWGLRCRAPSCSSHRTCGNPAVAQGKSLLMVHVGLPIFLHCHLVGNPVSLLQAILSATDVQELQYERSVLAGTFPLITCK
jgi:hypothetical protein